MQALEVRKYVVKLIAYGVEPKNIGVVTPYQKQVMKIRKFLEDREIDVSPTSGVKVGTAEEFQVGCIT